MKKYILGIAFLGLIACGSKEQKQENEALNVVTTTTMITDMLKAIGGEAIEVKGLMGAGVDPHLYKASEGDVSKLFLADAVFYNGLHLEGKLEEVFEKMKHQNKQTFAISDTLAKTDLIASSDFASNYDPHIWFNIDYWTKMTQYTTNKLIQLDPKNKDKFIANSQKYLAQIATLKKELNHKVTELPTEKRILVTAHDAFNYFGQSFDFQVVGLQGLSTATEAGVQDVQKLAKFIIENKVKAVFVESSVPKQTIDALKAAVESKDEKVSIGGTLYSDALGNAGTKEGTYIGMYQYNMNTIVNALK